MSQKGIAFYINLEILCAIFNSPVCAQFWTIVTLAFLIWDRQNKQNLSSCKDRFWRAVEAWRDTTAKSLELNGFQVPELIKLGNN